MDPHSSKRRGKNEGKEKGERGVHTPPLSGSLLPVVMVIRGFGQDYEIFYLVTSALLERTSKPARSMSVSLTPLVLGSKDSVCDLHLLQHANICTLNTSDAYNGNKIQKKKNRQEVHANVAAFWLTVLQFCTSGLLFCSVQLIKKVALNTDPSLDQR